MTSVTAYIAWLNGREYSARVLFDILPWLNHALPAIYPDSGTWTALSSKTGRACIRWIMANNPPEWLVTAMPQQDSDKRMIVDVAIDSADLRMWLRSNRLKTIATNAVDGLIGGEP